MLTCTFQALRSTPLLAATKWAPLRNSLLGKFTQREFVTFLSMFVVCFVFKHKMGGRGWGEGSMVKILSIGRYWSILISLSNL